MNRKAKEFLEGIGYTEEKEETVKLFNKHNFNIANLIGQGDRHHEYMHLTSDHTEVTNGHYLCRVSSQSIPKEELPTNNGLEPLEPSPEKIEALIDGDSAKRIQKNIPSKKDVPIGFLKSAWIGKNTNGEEVEFLMTDLNSWTPIIARKGEGRFPDAKNIIPKNKPKIELGFNPLYMKKLCEQIVKMGIRGVSLSIYGDDKPMKITGKTTDTETGAEQEVLILLMPMRV